MEFTVAEGKRPQPKPPTSVNPTIFLRRTYLFGSLQNRPDMVCGQVKQIEIAHAFELQILHSVEDSMPTDEFHLANVVTLSRD